MAISGSHLFPGEDEAYALHRRVKMHEFLIPGGIQLGVTDGKMQYSDPIIVDEWAFCPWHDSEDTEPDDICQAWAEIRAGRNPQALFERLQEQLADREREFLIVSSDDSEEVREDAESLALEIADLQEQVARAQIKAKQGISILDGRNAPATPPIRNRFDSNEDYEPFWAMLTEDGGHDEATILCNAHQAESHQRAKAISAAGPGVQYGKWKRVPRHGRECIVCATGEKPVSRNDGFSHGYGGNPWDREQTGYSPRRRNLPPPPPDARDDAAAAFGMGAVPDEIEFGEDESEEDD